MLDPRCCLRELATDRELQGGQTNGCRKEDKREMSCSACLCVFNCFVYARVRVCELHANAHPSLMNILMKHLTVDLTIIIDSYTSSQVSLRFFSVSTVKHLLCPRAWWESPLHAVLQMWRCAPFALLPLRRAHRYLSPFHFPEVELMHIAIAQAVSELSSKDVHRVLENARRMAVTFSARPERVATGNVQGSPFTRAQAESPNFSVWRLECGTVSAIQIEAILMDDRGMISTRTGKPVRVDRMAIIVAAVVGSPGGPAK